ncbi:hypothetical protein ACWEOE_29985 [Amycolatopsis sp. NPDC004368]
MRVGAGIGEHGDWNPSWDLSQASLTIWSGGSWSWFTDTVPILDVNFTKNQLTMKYNTRYALHNSGGGSRYFLQNSLSFLDQPGEFYVDYKNGEVYYWPKNGAQPTNSSVIRPTVQTVLDVAGSSPEHRAHDITFDGVGVQYSDYVEWYRNGWINDGDSGDVHQYPQYDRQVEMLQEAGLDSGDMGAFYTYGVDNFEPHTLDNYVSQVVIGDVIPDASMPDSGTRGVHMDAGGCGFSFTDIEVGKVTDDKYQSYDCNTVTNANWATGFDASRMQYDKIGVTAAFPYPRPPATVSPTK